MFYIKLDENMDLVTTVREPLFRGDNLNRKIVYLIPLTVGDIDILNAYVYLNYVRADGVADVVTLERMEEKYNESYCQYTFPVTCKLTKYPGEVCTWMQIYTGTPSNPTIQKTGECMLQIQDSKNMDDYICDHQLSAIYALQKQAETTGSNVDTIRVEMEKKGDNLVYDSENKILQMSSNGNPVGDAIDMSEMVNDDETIHFGEENGDVSADADAVIYFG